MITLAGVELELFEDGEGAPLLFLHGGQGFVPSSPMSACWRERRRLIAPSHPGFGKSEPARLARHAATTSPTSISSCWTGSASTRSISIGCSIGGWIAAELATKAPERLRKLVLVGPVGVKTGPVDKLDIPDIFAHAAGAS